VQFVIDPRSAKPLYVQLMDEVRRLIVTGELATDAALPSVRQLAADIDQRLALQLAADLRINHNTIVQAYRELERESLVYVRRGQGTFVAAQAAPDAQRDRVLDEVAGRAVADAHRHGFTREELIEALRAVRTPSNRETGNG